MGKGTDKGENTPPSFEQKLDADHFVMKSLLEEAFNNCSDIVIRDIIYAGAISVLMIYIDGSVNTAEIDQILMGEIPVDDAISQRLQMKLTALAPSQIVQTVGEVVEHVIREKMAIVIDETSQAIILDVMKHETRGIEEPTNEIAVRGPRDGFTESLRINTNLVRRRLHSPLLKMESRTMGDVSKTPIVISYLKGIARESMVNEVRDRIDRISIDAILGSGYIEELIEDRSFTPFPQIQNTERPDVVCAGLLEGKVAIFTDATPFILLLPMTFWSGLQAAEDYSERFLYMTFIRWIRFTLVGVSLFLPSFYVAVIVFSPQLIPTNLLISVAEAREGVPFPTLFEVLLMEFMFEGLREAGVRLPKPIGSTVSIVGALVIGQAAVQAGIISAPTVIIVSTTGIASFAVPRYNLGIAFRLLRFPLLFLAGSLGLFGMTAGAAMILIHLVNLRSFGVPYFSPMAPQIFENLIDVVIRPPWWLGRKKAALMSNVKETRIPSQKNPFSRRKGQRL